VLNGLSSPGDTVGKGILGLFLVFVGYNGLAYITSGCATLARRTCRLGTRATLEVKTV
jgi:hypothetical protein